MDMPLGEGAGSVEDGRKELIAKIRENIAVRRFSLVETNGTLGAYLHGLAGDLVAERLGADAMNSADLVEGLPAAWQQLRKLALP